MGRTLAILVVASVLVCGCEPRVDPDLEDAGPQIDPLPVQQARAYPETVTGMFLSLADFEDTPDGRGDQQIEHFAVLPGGAGERKFVVNITRTGAGAMEVVLPPRAALAFRIPDIHDFTGYTLVSLALYSESLRDDLTVTLVTDEARWTSHRTLLMPGWNNVLIDIRRLERVVGFDVTDVREMHIAFANAASPVTFNLDDVMVLDNRRKLTPVPHGADLAKAGLDYTLIVPHRDKPVALAMGSDGLWRLGDIQADVQVVGPRAVVPAAGEDLEWMGPRRLGTVNILEHNAVRIRLANTWYFPTRVGEWASLAVRQIRWEYTFYHDGRWVTHVELNNAGGQQIGSVRFLLPQRGAWADAGVSKDRTIADLAGPVGRWNCLVAPPKLRAETLESNYIRPGKIRTAIAAADFFAPGDADRDGFDETQGCYSLQARAGHCRFTILPPEGGLIDPVIRVAGRWKGDVSVNSEGLAIRDVVRLEDGSMLFVVPGFLKRPTAVEVVGDIPPDAEPG